MTPAEELAAAADKLDALATEATDGPWAVSRRDGGSTLGIEAGEQGFDEVVMPGDVRCGSYCYGGTSVIDATEADWLYIAAMNPLVGNALAVLLRRFEMACMRDVRPAPWSLDSQRVDDRIPGLTAALDLARLINGIAS